MLRRDVLSAHEEVRIVHTEPILADEEVLGLQVPHDAQHVHRSQGLADLEGQVYKLLLGERLQVLLAKPEQGAQGDRVHHLLGEVERALADHDLLCGHDGLVHEAASSKQPEDVHVLLVRAEEHRMDVLQYKVPVQGLVMTTVGRRRGTDPNQLLQEEPTIEGLTRSRIPHVFRRHHDSCTLTCVARP